ncbi:MAG: acyl-CoA dehydrogenase family protein [Planctomycetes bacterium]|nr:acyl-CoA dehydrogenase family protein [Planctomycetota bacterium]MCB9936531.1 acyl-CoA dehydrogenase family protein [Planctomycetota bacterium]
MAKYVSPDFFNLDDMLNEDEKNVRDTVREFVDDNVMPVIEEHYEKGSFPTEIIPKLGELGVLGASLPEQYGCAGMNNIAYGLINQELERGDSGVRSFASVQSALVMYPIYAYGSEEQKTKWLPELAAARMIGCFGLTEPDFGSNPAGMITRAHKDGKEWVINGAKMWITNGNMADIAVVWAKTGDSDDPKSIRGFVVEKGMEGYEVREQHHKASLRASNTSELFFTDVRVPEENMLPKAEGLKGPLGCLTQARYGIAWGAIGAAMACFDIVRQYAAERVVFGKPLAAHQTTQHKLTKMLTEITKGQLLAWHLGKLKDAGKMSHYQVSMAKMNNVGIALDVARTAREMLGANGISLEYHVIRHMCNLESVKTYEGTNDVHSLAIGQHITGISAFG